MHKFRIGLTSVTFRQKSIDEIIAITPKEGVAYRRTLMQHLSRRSPYGEFSIPLYAMTEEDRETILKAMEKHIKIEKQA